MNKNKLPLLVLLLVALFLSTEVMAQGGRGRKGNQAGGSKGQRSGRGQAGQRKQGNLNSNQNKNQTSPQGNRAAALTEKEIQGLILMREEEKLARDVYTALQAKWNDKVFANISRAESKHLSAVGTLLSRYGIPDPIQNNARGVFTSPQFQQLYKTLVADGSNSLEDALKVGLKIEEMDIADLRTAIESSKNNDITRVFENLLRGSRNHLRAFSSRLSAVGGNYVPTYLKKADFDQIAKSKQETGRNSGQQGGRGMSRSGQKNKGNGNGKGRGNGN